MGRIVHIELQNARFYAYHGFYPEEQVLGNEFYLSIRTSYELTGTEHEDLGNTVNYETLYQIAQKAMAQPKKLLETVANDILSEINDHFPLVSQVNVSIMKVNPPFGGDQANAKVSLHWKH